MNLCDDLQRITTRMRDPELGREQRSRLRTQSRRKVARLARDLRAYRFRGPLAEVMRQYRLTPQHFLVLAHLLHRHLRSEEPAVQGRVLLSSVFETSFEVLTGLDLLREESPLRASGLVVLDDDGEPADDLLEARFRISEEAVLGFRDEVGGFVPEDLRRGGQDRYYSNREFLIDLRILHNLYKERSERVFHSDRWDRLHNTALSPGRGLTRRIEAMWQRVRRRLDLSEGKQTFPAVRFFREHMLGEQEMVIVVHLLFKELYEGNAYADAAELVRLVSADEAELIENRRFVVPNGTLRRREIIEVEPMLEGRELTGEVHLADWVVNSLFGPPANVPDRQIEPDEKLEWHLYLQGLRESDRFFRDLEN
ncbi:MAG TPA: hypothetical protein VK081_06360 [Planctomycetota bacterium]|nr:hypothetical protein [Planctomycetota bacterium]